MIRDIITDDVDVGISFFGVAILFFGRVCVYNFSNFTVFEMYECVIVLCGKGDVR